MQQDSTMKLELLNSKTHSGATPTAHEPVLEAYRNAFLATLQLNTNSQEISCE